MKNDIVAAIGLIGFFGMMIALSITSSWTDTARAQVEIARQNAIAACFHSGRQDCK